MLKEHEVLHLLKETKKEEEEAVLMEDMMEDNNECGQWRPGSSP